MQILRKSFTLILCFTIFVMFIGQAFAEGETKTLNSTKHCVKDDSQPECQAHKQEVEVKSASSDKKTGEQTKTQISISVDEADEHHERDEDCTHGIQTNCIDAFHSAMAPPCHEYIPQGKYAEARAAVPAMIKASKEIAEYYPGCTYGKNINEQFKVKRDAFIKRVDELEKACGADDQAFKLAFDKMHSAFAEMNGVLYMRPDGVEEFHNILARIWHDFLPNKKYDEIKESLPELIKAAENLTSVKLDESMADKQEAFTQQAEKLLQYVNELKQVCETEDKEKIASTTETLHKSYEALTATF